MNGISTTVILPLLKRASSFTFQKRVKFLVARLVATVLFFSMPVLAVEESITVEQFVKHGDYLDLTA